MLSVPHTGFQPGKIYAFYFKGDLKELRGVHVPLLSKKCDLALKRVT